MKNVITIVGIIVVSIVILVSMNIMSNQFLSRAPEVTKNINNDTLRVELNVGDTKGDIGLFMLGIENQFFEIVKENEYHKVYIFQNKKRDNYGKYIYVDKIMCNDLSLNEYEEMRKFTDFDFFYLHRSNSNIKYVFTPLD